MRRNEKMDEISTLNEYRLVSETGRYHPFEGSTRRIRNSSSVQGAGCPKRACARRDDETHSLVGRPMSRAVIVMIS